MSRWRELVDSEREFSEAFEDDGFVVATHGHPDHELLDPETLSGCGFEQKEGSDSLRASQIRNHRIREWVTGQKVMVGSLADTRLKWLGFGDNRAITKPFVWMMASSFAIDAARLHGQIHWEAFWSVEHALRVQRRLMSWTNEFCSSVDTVDPEGCFANLQTGWLCGANTRLLRVKPYWLRRFNPEALDLLGAPDGHDPLEFEAYMKSMGPVAEKVMERIKEKLRRL